MKIMRLLAVTALCMGFAQVVSPATMKVGMFKTDPNSFETTWSYQVFSQKKDNDNKTKLSPLKTFRQHTVFSIDPSDFDIRLRLYATNAGPADAAPVIIPLNGMIQNLQDKKYGLAVDKERKVTIQLNPKTAQIHSIHVNKINDDGRPWTIRALDGKDAETSFEYGKTTIKKNTEITQKLKVPKDRAFFIIIDRPGIGAMGPVPKEVTLEEAQKMKSFTIAQDGTILPSTNK